MNNITFINERYKSKAKYYLRKYTDIYNFMMIEKYENEIAFYTQLFISIIK